VGPSDLSITLSKGAGIDKTGQATLAAMKKIADAARRNNLVAGAFGGNAEVVRAYLELGYRFIAAGVDADILQAGAAALVKAIKGV
jgi:4-hydroxy-2-oxoheptanedioate aldolase